LGLENSAAYLSPIPPRLKSFSLPFFIRAHLCLN